MIEFKSLVPSDEELIRQTAVLYRKVMEFEMGLGISIHLVDGGEFVWAEEMKRILGKFGCLLTAVDEGKVVAFVSGTIRLLPKYYGYHKVGYLEFMYVDEKYRGKNIGSEIFRMLESFFREKGMATMEVNVVTSNLKAARFYEKAGMKPELVNLRKNLTPSF